MGERSGAQLVAYGVAALLLVLVVVRSLTGGGGDADTAPVALDETVTTASETGTAPGGEAGSGGDLFVHVAGAVRRPGLYRVPAGARAGAAIERAGGLAHRAELAGINLAAPLQDGQQVLVPKRGATPAPAGPTDSASGGAAPTSSGASPDGAAEAPISLATATVEQLDAGVEGIGPTLAANIIEYRDQNGGFQSIEELREVSGIGEVRFEALRQAVVP